MIEGLSVHTFPATRPPPKKEKQKHAPSGFSFLLKDLRWASLPWLWRAHASSDYLVSQSVALEPAASASLEREKCRVSDLTPDLLVQNLHFNKIPRWFTCTLWFEKHSRIPQRNVKMEAQKYTVCTEKELGEERGASQVPSLAKLWCAESHSLAQYLLSFSEFHFPFFSVSFKSWFFQDAL